MSNLFGNIANVLPKDLAYNGRASETKQRIIR